MSDLKTNFPAKYSSEVIDAVVGLLAPLDVTTILDPMAGVGGIHQLAEHGYETVGAEIEPGFALEADRLYPSHPTWCMDSAKLEPGMFEPFDACVVSPAYGNRMADQYLPKGDQADKYRRFSYAISLGRELNVNSGARYHFGRKGEYEELHEKIWAAVSTVIKPTGYFLLNISDFVRDKKLVPVTQWHVTTLNRLGWTPMQYVPVKTRRMRYGANNELRAVNEWAILFERL